MLVVSCKDGNSSNSAQEIPDRSNVIINVPRGEQAPPANPGQRNFGGMMPMGGNANRQRPQRPQGQGQAAQRPAQVHEQEKHKPALKLLFPFLRLFRDKSRS